jgi:chromosome segregation ATPase
VEQLKFQLRVDAEELSAEQKTRLQLEQEMADLKRQLDKEASMKSDIEGQLAISSEVRQELEQRAERIRHSLQQCVSSISLPSHSCVPARARLCVAHARHARHEQNQDGLCECRGQGQGDGAETRGRTQGKV